MPDQIGKDPAGGDVVAEAEAAGEAENLKLIVQTRLFEQPIDVQRYRLARQRAKRHAPFRRRSSCQGLGG